MRRKILIGAGAAVVVAVAAFAVWRFASDMPADVLTPYGLPDMAIGNEKAPVTIVEYASMTCPHCAHFNATTFVELKKRYIDAGKVRYILREFPLDELALAGAALARCRANGDAGQYLAVVDTLFRRQKEWLVDEPLEPLTAIAKDLGFTAESFNACLANQPVLDGIEKVRRRAIDKLKVQSTPTLFINGKLYTGDVSIEELAKHIDPYLIGG